MTTETTRTPQVGETWRYRITPAYTIDVRYVDEAGAYGPDMVGDAAGIPTSDYHMWEPAPPSRPSIDFTRWVHHAGPDCVSAIRIDNAPGVHVWSDEDGNLHAEWID